MTQLRLPPPSMVGLHADRWTRPFWEAARRHTLVAPRCASCDVARMPPGPWCPSCRDGELAWVPASGQGVVHTFTIARQAFHPDLESAIPYALVIVTLEDHPDVRLPTNLTGIADHDVAIGLPVAVWWDDVSSAVTVPRFAPATSGRSG